MRGYIQIEILSIKNIRLAFTNCIKKVMTKLLKSYIYQFFFFKSVEDNFIINIYIYKSTFSMSLKYL